MKKTLKNWADKHRSSQLRKKTGVKAKKLNMLEVERRDESAAGKEKLAASYSVKAIAPISFLNMLSVLAYFERLLCTNCRK